MAQSRNRRRRGVKARSNRATIDRMRADARTVRIRRIVIVFLLLLGLAGVLALSPSSDDAGAPVVPVMGV